MRLFSFLRAWLATFVAFGIALALMLASPSASAAITFDPTPSTGGSGLTQMEIIQDAGNAALSGAYLGVKFSSNIALTNVYARVTVGGAGYSLDATEAQDHFIGDLSGTAKTSYWFINYPTSGNGTFTVQIYTGNPAAGGLLQGTSTTYTVSSANADNSAAANKIVSVAVVPATVQLGQTFNVVVCYSVNSTARLLVEPAISSAFDPNNLRLGNVVVDVYASADCTGAATATLANQLLFAGPVSSNSARATYTFQTVGTVSVALTPIVSARSGIYKYNSDFNTPPAGVSYTVPAPTNSVTLAKSVNIASNSVGNIGVTYTITATNAGSSAVVLDEIIDTLPSSPGAVTYTANSTTVNGSAQASFNPVISGQTLTWGSTGSAGTTFTVPAGGTLTLGFNAVIPAANGVYTNSAIAKINTTQIDTTASTGDNAPATATTRIGPPVLVVTKTADTPTIINTATGTTARYTLKVTNSGTAATGVTLNDTALPAGFTYLATVAISTPTSGSCATAATRTSVVNPAVGATSPSWGNFSIPGGCEVSVQFDASVASSVADGTYNNSATTTTATAGATITNFDGTPVATTVDNVTVTSPVLAVTKTTSTPNVAPIGTATYTLTVTNSGTANATGVKVTDTLPAGFTYASTTSVTLNGTAVAAAGFTAGGTAAVPTWDTNPSGGFTVNAGQTLVIVFNATASSVTGTYNNSASATSSNAKVITNFDGTTSTAEDVAVVAMKLTVTKVFSPNSIGTGDSTLLKISLVNPNAIEVTGAAFTDTYPASMFNTATPGAVITGAGCSGTVTAAANGGSLDLTGGNVPASGSCDITVSVTSAAANTYVNSSGAVSTTNAGTSTAVNGTLMVLSHVTVLKAFTPTAVAVNATSVLNITLTNPNAVAITGVAFNDVYPSGLVNTSTPGGAMSGAGCSGTVTAAANGTSLVLSGGSVPAGGSCLITANVSSGTAGSYVNNSGAVTTANAGSGATSSATLTVTVVAPPPAPQVAKSFTPNSIGVNGTTLLKITLVNGNAFALTSVAFTDTYPASMFNTATPGGVISGTAGCSGTVTAANNGSSLALSGGNLPANGTCDVSVSVTSAVVGTYVNSSGAVASAEAPNGTAATGTLTVLGNVTVLKAFTPNSVATNATSVLKITLTNPNTVPITGAAFTDTYPGGLVNTATPAGAISGAGCSGTITAAANGTSLALSGGNVPASSSCDITVNVTSATAGSYVNNSGAVTTANAGSGATSSATLTVTVALQAPGVSKTFTPAVILTGDNSLLRVTITNPNVVAITGAAFSDTYPATLSNTGSAAFNAASTLAGCTGTITGSTGTTSLALTNGSIPAGVSCMIDVNVTSNSAVPVLLTNPAFSVSTGNTPSGNAAAANLQVLVRPTIAKSFTPNTVLVGASSTLSLVITNPNPIPLSALAFTDTFPAGLAVAGAPNAVNGCGGTFSASAGATSIALSGGSLAANQSCTLSVDVSSAAASAYSNTSGGVSSFETGAAGAPSNTAVLTVNAPAGVQLSGFVYSDLNHNLQRDGGEVGTGLVLYAKLVATSSPAGPALQAVLVNSATGAYQFSSVSPGDYFIVIDDNATLADVTPTIPAGWLGTEMPSSVRANLLVSATDLQNLNFGLFNGSTVSGIVFADTGIVGGIANNGIKDGGEPGIAGVTVKASTGATTYDSTMTDGAGNYTLWIPAAATSPVAITETNLGGYLSTGGGAGTTAGTYTRTSDSTGFTFAAGLSYVNVNFGDVPVNRLIANGQQTGSPGNALFYPHQFNAGSGGTVSFSVASASGWPVVLFRDSNCNGVIDAGENVISAAITVVAAEQVCLINKVTIPTGTALGVQDIATLQASFTYTNASPALLGAALVVLDTSTAGVGSGGLVLTKTADKATALPGETITYTISYKNNGSTPISTIIISDTTPAYTNFFAASCGSLPAAVTTCTVSTQPALAGVGSIQWQLGGSLNSASTGQVSFSVKVNN